MIEIDPADWAAIVQSNQFYAGFLARASHELRSPLSSLMSLHQLILNDLCDSHEEERDCINQAYQAANRLLKMLELVTYISKVEVGLSPLQIDTICLHTLFEDVRSLTQIQAANRNITLLMEIPGEDPLNPPLKSDYRMLRQSLFCLVESSLYALSSGVVKLWCPDPIRQNSLVINIATTPPLAAWQDLNNFSLENPEKSWEILQASDQNFAETVPGDRSCFSLEYSLIISQILLQRINGKLLLMESDQADHPFYLQCRLEN